jgi:predicted NBD/HSP70 family sugar kinase
MDRAAGSPSARWSPRAANRSRVLAVLSRSAPLSRGDLSRLTGLSRGTVSSIVRELVSAGELHEVAGPDTGARPGNGSGRPPALLAPTGPPGVLVGVDIGHRHVRVAVSDLAARVVAERAVLVDVDQSASNALDTAAELVAECLAEAEVRGEPDRVAGVGMGVPGPIDPHTGVGSLPVWAGIAPARELGRRIGLPVRVDNDANLGALGELEHGAARGHADLIYVKAATGIGAGLVLGGRLHRGATGIAGEIGHVRFDDSGAVCWCGNRGCLETVVAAPRLVQLLQPAYPEPLTVQRMLDLAVAEDVGANRLLDDAGRAVGRVLADLCNHLNPSLIVVGGDMGRSGAFRRGVADSVERYAQPDTVKALCVVPSELGERAQVMGALVVARAGGDVPAST